MNGRKSIWVVAMRKVNNNAIFYVADVDEIDQAKEWIFYNARPDLYYEVWDRREYECKFEGIYKVR